MLDDSVPFLYSQLQNTIEIPSSTEKNKETVDQESIRKLNRAADIEQVFNERRNLEKYLLSNDAHTKCVLCPKDNIVLICNKGLSPL